MIKVMAGDKVDIMGKSYFLNTGVVNNTNSTALSLLSLMANMLLAPQNAALAKGFDAAALQAANSSLVPASFFRGSNGETTTIPKAYINYIFFDEQFKYAGGGASRVGSSGQVKDHWVTDPAQLSNITVPKNGYIFVYVSNESNLDVFFDNIQVVHKAGPIVEETHYYPFGLTMSGISSQAANITENKKKYNGIELENDFDLNIYDAELRELDPQTGRWWQIDPKTDEMYMWSTYASNFDNPIRYEDPLGDEPEECCPVAAEILRGAQQTSAAGIPGKAVLVGGAIVAGVVALGELFMSNSSSAATEGKVRVYTSSGTYVYMDDPLTKQAMQSNQTKDNVRNPDGAKGKPDHQEKVKELEKKAQTEAKPGETVVKERKIQGQESNRRPDVQIVDKNGKARKVFEAERKPNSQRNQKREAEYKKLKVKQETHPVGN